MGNAKYIGRVGALSVALGIGSFRRSATRMTVSIGAAVVAVMATAVPSPAPTMSPTVRLAADSTALIVCGGTCPIPDQYIVDSAMNQFITPTHPGQTITPVAVTTPSEAWPITGLLRLIGFAFGDSRLFGPGGPAWPDEPWWKLSGLFDLTADQSVQAGVADLEAAMAAHGNDHLVIFGYSMGANTANKEKRKLAEQYPPGTTAPDISFVLMGDPNLPNGGLAARFPGLPTVILGTFDGPEPTDTLFHTDVITRQYDGNADFPLYPLNVIADLNAVLGFMYVHTQYLAAVSLPADPTTSPAYQGTHGDSSYYFFETQDLPLFAPLRQLGVPESLIDVVEPFFRVVVELGYDRTIPPWEPTPARLISTLDPATVATDLVNAIGEGINNAIALVGLPGPLSTPIATRVAALGPEDAAPTAETSNADVSTDNKIRTERSMATESGAESEQISMDTVASTANEAETVTSDKGPTAAGAVEMSARDDTSELEELAERPATPRPVIRDSFDATEQPRDLSDRGDDGRSTSQTGSDDDEAPTGDVTSTPCESPSRDSDSPVLVVINGAAGAGQQRA